MFYKDFCSSWNFFYKSCLAGVVSLVLSYWFCFTALSYWLCLTGLVALFLSCWSCLTGLVLLVLCRCLVLQLQGRAPKINDLSYYHHTIAWLSHWSCLTDCFTGLVSQALSYWFCVAVLSYWLWLTGLVLVVSTQCSCHTAFVSMVLSYFSGHSKLVTLVLSHWSCLIALVLLIFLSLVLS